jgi:hypothetical protein
MDKDQLAALDRAATQGVWKTVEVDGIPYMQSVINDHTFPAEAPDDLYFAAALANAYRTGKLVLIDDGAVERVARAIAGSDVDDENLWQIYLLDARAALSALGVK